MKKHFLSDFAEVYAGPWPRALKYLLLVILSGPIIGSLIFAEPIAPRMFLGSFLVAVCAFVVGVWLKKRVKIDGN